MPETTGRSAAAAADVRLGMALGSGSALGLAHIGVLRVLEENGIEPQVVAGSSIGGLIGAAYVFGVLDRLETAARNVGMMEVLRLARLGFGGPSLLNGDSIVREIRDYIGEVPFSSARKPFAVVASDLVANEAVVLKDGPVVEALRATIAIPGIFPPVRRDGQLLADGGMKNPVPVSVCRELGATHVIAVDVTGDYRGQVKAASLDPDRDPSLYTVGSLALAMIMSATAEVNYHQYPPDVLIVPRIGHVKPYDFGEGASLIDAGRVAAKEALPKIRALLDRGASAEATLETS